MHKITQIIHNYNSNSEKWCTVFCFFLKSHFLLIWYNGSCSVKHGINGPALCFICLLPSGSVMNLFWGQRVWRVICRKTHKFRVTADRLCDSRLCHIMLFPRADSWTPFIPLRETWSLVQPCEPAPLQAEALWGPLPATKEKRPKRKKTDPLSLYCIQQMLSTLLRYLHISNMSAAL